MSKALSNILTIFKVAKIVAKVIFILTIVVGAIDCLLVCSLPLVGDTLLTSFFYEKPIDLPTTYLARTVGLITCAGEAVLAFLAQRYFGNVLEAKTPFTQEGSKECFRLGVGALIVSVATSLAAGITIGIFQIMFSTVPELDSGESISLSTGLFFMFLSLIFKHGAEVQASAIPQEPSSESKEQQDEGETV